MLYLFERSASNNSRELPTACKLNYHFSDDFLFVYKNHKFEILNDYLAEQNNSVNFQFNFPKMINAKPNNIMLPILTYANSNKIFNTNFLESLKVTLKYIQKGSIYPYILFGLHDAIKNALKMKPNHENSDLLKQSYENLRQLLEENCAELIASHNSKVKKLKQMR